MTAFDSKAYKEQVLRPWGLDQARLDQLKRVVRELQEDPASKAYRELDLPTLLGVPADDPAAALSTFPKPLLQALNKFRLPAAPLVKQLLASLEKRPDIALKDPAFWASLGAERDRAVAEQLTRSAQLLAPEYPLGVIPETEFQRRLSALGLSPDKEADFAAKLLVAGVHRVPDLRVPDALPSRAVDSAWRAVRKGTEFRSILDVVAAHRSGPVSDAQVADRLAVGGKPVGVADLARARTAIKRRKDSDDGQAADKLLGALASACGADGDLHAAVLKMLTDTAAGRLAQGRAALAVRQDLESAGLATQDAARIVLAVQGSGGARPVTGLDDVEAALARRELGEARRLIDGAVVPDSDARRLDKMRGHVDSLLARKQQHLRAFHDAFAAERYADALGEIDAALAIDAADPALAEKRADIPPTAPARLRWSADASGVQLSWEGAGDDTVTWTVVRREGRAPSGARDGTVVGTELTEPRCIDPDAPAGTELFYAVVAVRDGRARSRPSTAEQVVVLPSVTGLRAAADADAVTLQWIAPPDAVETLIGITRADDGHAEKRSSPGSRARIDGLSTGTVYQFTLEAVYLVAGARRLAPPVSIRTVPRAAATAVTGLEVVRDESAERLLASWDAVTSYRVELWGVPVEHAWAPGTMVQDHDLTGSGGRRLGESEPDGSPAARSEARLSRMPGVVRILAATRTDDGLLIGEDVVVGDAAPPQDVRAERFGDDVKLSWVWPDGDVVIQLEWRDGHGRRRRRVTRAAYTAQGGVRIHGADEVSDLSVATVMRIGDDEIMSAPNAVALPVSSVHDVEYSLSVRRPLFGAASCTISLRCDPLPSAAPMRLVMTRGSFMPASPERGETVSAFEADLTTGVFRHQVDLGKLRPGYWLRLFADDPNAIRMHDPSTSELKG